MELVLHMDHVTDENLRFAAQIGAAGITAIPPQHPLERPYYDFAELVHLRSRVESFGLRLEHVGHLPWHWRYKWMLGLPGRDEQIDNCQKTIRNIGAAGIPLFLYNVNAMLFARTSRYAQGRAGALATSFEIERVRKAPLMAGGLATDTSLIPTDRRPISDDEMWDNLAYFLKAVVPVAEEAGVKLALHPDDPPIPSMNGVACIMRNPEAFRRVIDIVPSENNGLLFCQGCFAEMGADVINEIRYFGSRNKIFFVHFRNIRGSCENFVETFQDDGQVDMLAAMKAYKEVGFEGAMSPDHMLRLEDDSEWGHRYWAYAIGYMKGLGQLAESMR